MDEHRDVELLVHIAAPGHAIDDRKYRSLASAYLNFEPTTRQNVFSTRDPAQSSPHDDHQSISARSESSLLREVAGLPSFVDTPDISLETALVSTNEGKRVADTAHPMQEAEPERSTAGSRESWIAPASFIQDSNPNNDITIPMFNSPTRILEKFISAMETQTQTQEATTPDEQQEEQALATQLRTNDVVPATQIEVPSSLPQEIRRELSRDDIPVFQTSQASTSSGIPDSFQMSQSSIRSSPTPSHGIPWLHLESQSGSFGDSEHNDPSNSIMSKAKARLSLIRPGSAPPAPKRPKVSTADGTFRPPPRAESDLAPHITRSQSFLSSGKSPGGASTMSLLELAAPSPAISMGKLEADDLVTEGLQKLSTEFNMDKRFRPKEISRAIRPFERGHWELDCGGWCQDLKKETWTFLRNYVTTGLAGWGVRCCRDESFTWMRVYCWGYVVGHIYLLLYMSSKRQVLVTGCSWIAGDGKPVIVMGAKGLQGA